MTPKIKIEGRLTVGALLYLKDDLSYTTDKKKASKNFPDPVARIAKGPVAEFTQKGLQALSLTK